MKNKILALLLSYKMLAPAHSLATFVLSMRQLTSGDLYSYTDHGIPLCHIPFNFHFLLLVLIWNQLNTSSPNSITSY